MRKIWQDGLFFLFLALAAGGLLSCHRAWEYRIVVVKHHLNSKHGDSSPVRLSGTTVRLWCPEGQLPVDKWQGTWGAGDIRVGTAVVTDAQGEAFFNGDGFGLSRKCSFDLSGDGIETRRYRIDDICISPYPDESEKGSSYGELCKEGVLRAEMNPTGAGDANEE